ncbi:hypothetical protein V5P93_004599 [Actinokineospora auranticolor]|nr:hypothetical protein [Actinokineospora auranticolor]
MSWTKVPSAVANTQAGPLEVRGPVLMPSKRPSGTQAQLRFG